MSKEREEDDGTPWGSAVASRRRLLNGCGTISQRPLPTAQVVDMEWKGRGLCHLLSSPPSRHVEYHHHRNSRGKKIRGTRGP